MLVATPGTKVVRVIAVVDGTEKYGGLLGKNFVGWTAAALDRSAPIDLAVVVDADLTGDTELERLRQEHLAGSR